MRHLDLSRFKNASSLSSGRHAGIWNGSGVEFRGLKEYGGGDSRAIDWKSSLRSGKTLERSYVADSEIPVRFVVDVSSSLGYGVSGKRPFDTALAAFDLLSASARKHGNPFGAMAFSDRIVAELPPTRSPSKVLAFRQLLEGRFNGRATPVFSKAFPMAELRAKIRSKSLIFVVSDRDFGISADAFRTMKRSNGFFLRIRHPLEDSIPESDVAVFRDEGVSFVSLPSRPNGHEDFP